MRNTDRWKAGNRPAVFAAEPGCRRRGQKIEPAPVRALLEGIAGAAEAANAERAAAIRQGLSR